MNFRVHASGLLLIVAYQLAIAAAVIWFVVQCETAAAAPANARDAAAPRAEVCG